MQKKFDLTLANWLLHLVDPGVSLSTLGQDTEDRDRLRLFLRKLTEGSISSLFESEFVVDNMKVLLKQLDRLNDEEPVIGLFSEIRKCFATQQWLAFVIPSGTDSEVDKVLCDPELFGYLVRSSSSSNGIILQLEQVPSTSKSLSLFNVHQVLKTALNECINWPGVLLWTPGGDSVFLPVNSVDFLEIDLDTRLQWIFSKLFSSMISNLGRLKVEYKSAFPEIFENENKTVNILQLSDLFIGNSASSHRVFRLQQFVRELVEDLGEDSKIIPVVTGNIMDSPSESHLEPVHAFWKFLSGVGAEFSILVFGNCDVRKDGNINESYRNAIGFQYSKVTWYEDVKIALISVNTVVHGNFENGSIGGEQIEAIEDEIERKKDADNFKFILLLHHAPLFHQKRNDSVRELYQQVIGYKNEPADIFEFEGTELLLEFAKKHSVSAMLHGHLQIPFVSTAEQGVSVIGCGSSIGTRSQLDGGVYFSINIISINHQTRKMASRLLMIRKPENGFVKPISHEMIFQTLI